MIPNLALQKNPVYDGYFADPFVFRADDTYYAIGTSPETEGIFTMLRSNDLANWTRIGYALEGPLEDIGTDFWAPEVAFSNGTYYMYFSAGWGDRGHKLRVAASPNPQGPYKDLGFNLIDPVRVPFAIDASPFQDVDGQWYLFYARDFLDSDRPGTALVVDRMVAMTKLAGEERVVMRATEDWQRFAFDREIYGGRYDWHTLEGPTVRRHGDSYYCFYSGGRWENETYGVDYATAPHPLGPWIQESTSMPRVLQTIPNQILGPGHNSIVTTRHGQPRIVYHAWDPSMTARRMYIDKLTWTVEGPRIA